jgi:hypothetical protein
VQHRSATDRLRADSTDLIYAATADARPAQLRTADALDTKATAVFAAATVVLGLAASGSDDGTAQAVLVGLAVAAYIAAAVAALWCFRIRRYRIELEPEYLWGRYWKQDPLAIKHAIIAERGTGFRENEILLEQKTRALKLAITFTAAETVLVGIVLLVSTAS